MESCSLETQRSVGRRPQSAHPGEAKVNTGWDGRPAEWAGNLGCLEVLLDLRPICLGSPIITIWLFGFLSNVPNGPFPRRLPRDPLCQGRAGMDRPQGHASPVTRAQKPRASRLLVGLPAGGLRWGQKWGEVNLPAAWIPVAALGTEIDGGWPVSPDPQT